MELKRFGLIIAAACIGAAVADDLEIPEFDADISRGAAAGYVEDVVCANCHKDKYDSYQAVGMARSFRHATTAERIEDFGKEFYHEPSQRYYQVLEQDGELTFRRYQRDREGEPVNEIEIPIAWVLGSGNRARTYLYQSDWGEMYMLPVGWYSETQSWAMSPGFEAADHDGINRRIQRKCMFCHNAYPEVPTGSDLHWATEVFPQSLPEGTGCQRCHGPGADHVRNAVGGVELAATRAAIVNPAKLPVEERDSVCFQCHLLPAVSVTGVRQFDRTDYSFRPGEKLSDYLVNIDVAEQGISSEERFEINHHGYRLFQSQCYQQSAGELGCISCHDPHKKPASGAFRNQVSDTCSGCHMDAAAMHNPGTTFNGSNCVSCHMPRRRTGDVVQVTMTDHRIATGPFDLEELVEPEEKVNRQVTGLDILPFGEVPQGNDALAYRAVAAMRAGRSVPAARNGLLQALNQASFDSPVPYLDLARSHLQLGNYAQAEAGARGLVAGDSELHVAHTLLGIAQIGQGKIDPAIQSLQQSLRIQPDPETHFNLAIAYLSSGRNRDALEELDAAIELRPLMASAWRVRGRILVSGNQLTEAKANYLRSLQLDPGDATTYLEFVELLRAIGEQGDAERYLEVGRRVARNPAQLR